MKIFTFNFKGVSSDEYGLYASIPDEPFNTRKRKSHKKIDFRDGVYDFENDVHDPQTLEMECFWKKPINRHDIREMALWLTGKDRLIRDFEPDKHYNATVYNRSELITFINRWDGNEMPNGKFRLTWYCADPFAYSEQTTTPISSEETDIDYRGTASTPTLIRLINNTDQPIRNITVTALSLI